MRAGSLESAGRESAEGKKYTGLMPSEVRRLKQLDDENRCLKQMMADLSLDKAMLQDVLSINV